MFSTDFIFNQQDNLIDNQKCQAGFRPLSYATNYLLIYDTCLDQCEDPPCGAHCYCPICRPNVQGSRPSGDNKKTYVSYKPGTNFRPDNFVGNPKIPGSLPGDGSINGRPGGSFGSNPGSYPGSIGNYPGSYPGKRGKYKPDGIYYYYYLPYMTRTGFSVLF